MASPVRVEWYTTGGDLLCARAMTRDISAVGIYCYIEHPLAAGLEVEFDVLFPGELTRNETLLFRCRGRVLRTERLHNRFGVPILIQSRHLIEAGELHRLHRRGSVRVHLSLVAEYSGLHATVRDLSLSGAFIEDYDPLPVGREIGLHIKGPELQGEIIGEAIVRRVEPRVGMAMEFVALSADADRRLREFFGRSTKPR